MTQLPPDDDPPPFFPSQLRPVCPSVAKDLQQDVEQRDELEDGCFVDGRQAIRLLVQKSVVSTKAADGEKKMLNDKMKVVTK